MSIPLPIINLSNVSIGQSGTVSFANTGISAGGISSNPSNTRDAGKVLIYNESGSGLLITFLTSQSGFYLPAGGWQPVPIQAGETGYKWTVIYNLPAPPVTQLLTTYYYPGEVIPPQPTLGNSPIGIGGTVTTSSVQTLSNEGNSSLSLVIDIGQVGHTQLITINNDGSAIWSVLRGGIAHTVLQIEASGNPLLLGQAGDTVEAVSQFTFDALAQFNILSPPLGNIAKIDAGGITLQAGSINLLTGTITRMVIDGPFTIHPAGTTVNHSLGAVPDFVFPISDTGNATSASLYGVNFGTMSSTQVTLYCSNDNGGSGTRTWIMSFKK
jgi:hypothetical protein